MESLSNVADKASRLFQFLADLQSQKEKPVRQMSEFGGKWITLQDVIAVAESASVDLALSPALARGLDADNLASDNPQGILIEVRRPTPVDAPTLPSQLENVITGDIDNADRRPVINNSSDKSVSMDVDLEAQAEGWLKTWDEWAAAAKAHKLYQILFDMQVKSHEQADEYELVLGFGWLNWDLGPNDSVDRPVFTLSVSVEMDKFTGTITIRESAEPLKAELNVLPADHIEDGRFIEGLKGFISEFEGDPSDQEEFGELARFTANGLSTRAQYEAVSTRPARSRHAVLTWAPTLILRTRQRIGLATTFREIADRIEEEGVVPAGLRPLVDTGYSPKLAPTNEQGALLKVGREVFSPLPLNDKQLRVLNHVDEHAHTIVQGPPGTGKTHMAAALLSHLLAQGKRVLVTAQTERALYELREKMPSEVRELAVSVIGSSSQEMSDLRTAVETIQRKSSTFDQAESDRAIRTLEDTLSRLKEQRTRILREWTEKLEAEQAPANLAGYNYPFSTLVEKMVADRENFDWIEQLEILDLERKFPLHREQISHLLTLLNDPEVMLVQRAELSAAFDPALFGSPDEFEIALRRLEQAEKGIEELNERVEKGILTAWENLSPNERLQVQATVSSVDNMLRDLRSFTAPWTQTLGPNSSIRDFEHWRVTHRNLSNKFAGIQPQLAEIRDLRMVSVDGSIDSYVPMAVSLKEYLSSGKTLAVKPDGTVKAPVFGGGTVKAALPFLNGVRLNGMPPTTNELVSKFLAYVNVSWELQMAQRIWPFIRIDPSEPVNAADYLQADLDQFGQYLDLLNSLNTSLSILERLGFEPGLETALEVERLLPFLNQFLEMRSALEDARSEFEIVSGSRAIDSSDGEKPRWIAQLGSSIHERNAKKYRDSLEQGLIFHSLSLKQREARMLLDQVGSWSPELANVLQDEQSRTRWAPLLPLMEDAQNWLMAKRYVERHTETTRDDGVSAVAEIDREMHAAISALAAERAWRSAVGAERIDGRMRATMQAYVQAVRRLGKGKGTHAEQHRRDVRRHLDRAREAVPVWIMPIYKVVEQFALNQDMFDVIVVDEASQAGIESIFLQYLAPKIVVVGDDRQVSPAAVGVDIDKLAKTARQYLYDFENVDAWKDPGRSLFDDANMRYGGRIALDEHRRCVPEIIEFSNELVYRPGNIELKPVREVGASRLAPFRVTRTPNAFEEGKKVNRAEADTLVARLLTAIESPEYDGKTFGVISLLSSSAQGDYIQKRLLGALPPRVWEERSLKVGNPADFQGAERDVIFLSMVSPAPQGTRPSSLTQLQHEQRYNVAVSRAKDQVWLFHSIGVEDLQNHEDVRYKLLEYAYRVAEASPEARVSQLVSPDVPTEPFDSLFEQRVYNELVVRGYYVIPQHDAFGRRIDLVVQGNSGRLAVECDGDYWHSEEHALADQARQRELERLGWVFVRLFESDFYLDKEREIQRIVDRLEHMGIRPGYVEGVDPNNSPNVEVIENVFDGEITADRRPHDETMDAFGPPVDEDAALFVGEASRVVGLDTAREKSEPQLSDSVTSATEVNARYPKPYEVFDGWTVSVKEAGPTQVDEGLLRIIAVEGPISEQLLFQRYVKAGGDSRVRDYARDVLRAGVVRLVRRGEVVQVSRDPRIYRTPNQTNVIARTRGSRNLDDVSDAEWAVHMEAAINEDPGLTGEALYRRASQRVGFRRFTENMHAKLEVIHREIQ